MFEKDNLKSWVAANQVWTLANDLTLTRASDGKRIDGSALSKKLNPRFEPQMFAIDRLGVVRRVQNHDLKSEDWNRLAATYCLAMNR